MKRDSTEFKILQSLNSAEIRSDPWNPAPNLLYTAERGDDAILCFERLFGCDNPPLQTVANVIDYIRQALEVIYSFLLRRPFALWHLHLHLHLHLPPFFASLASTLTNNIQGLCFLHEHNIVHHAYGDPRGVMMDIGRPTTADFDRTRFPVRYYRVDFARAQQLLRDADPRSASFCSDVSDCGSLLQVLVEEVPKIGGKLRSLVVAMIGGEYGAEDALKLFEALCQGIDASTYDAPLHPSRSR